jgi:hypothetical protein
VILADRARKARRYSQCHLCRRRVSIGQVIVKTGQSWVHARCAAARIRSPEGPMEDRSNT